MARPRTPKGRAREVAARLADEYPGTAVELCALQHDGPFQLLVATMLNPAGPISDSARVLRSQTWRDRSFSSHDPSCGHAPHLA